MSSIEDKKQTLIQKQEEIKRLQAEINEEERVEKLKEKASKYFDKNFGLSWISDNFNVYPEEYYSQIKTKFVNLYEHIENNNNTKDNNLTKEEYIRLLREEYMKMLKDDIEMLQEKYDSLQTEMEKFQE